MESTVFVAFLLAIINVTESTAGVSLDLSQTDGQSTVSECRMRYCHDMSSQTDIHCKCDSTCWREQMCCLNFLDEPSRNSETDQSAIPKSFIERGQLYQCHKVKVNVRRNAVNHYSLLSRCISTDLNVPQSWRWHKSQCERTIDPNNADDYLLMIPVTNSKTGESYKNVYCAACNDDLEDTVFWETNAVCNAFRQLSNVSEAVRNLNVEDEDGHPVCELEFQQPSHVVPWFCREGENRRCPSSFFSMANSSGDLDKLREIEWLCQVTHGIVQIGWTTYENPYCAACHFNETDIDAVISGKYGACLNSYRYFFDSIYAPPMRMFKSFAVLLDFDFTSSRGNSIGLTQRCPQGQFYDAVTDKCRMVICTEPYYYHDGLCHLPAETESVTDDSDPISEVMEDSQLQTPFLKCPKIRLELSEGIVLNNGTLIVNQQKIYAEGTFKQVDNETFYVCRDLSDNYVVNFNDHLHTYITIICTSISLVALFLKMIIFVFIREIRKFPDKMVFCLSVSLFIAQSLFISTASFTNYPVCASIGVLNHYFFLSSFSWMNVLAYDVWKLFTKCSESRSIDPDGMKRRFYCYSLYAWLTPMLIVSAACVFDWGGLVDESSVMRPRYGVVFCWISTRTALLFYFAAPMAVLLLTNIAFFVTTAVNICRASRAVQALANSHDFSQQQNTHQVNFSIYVKLAVIMGLTWVSGFVATFSDQQWLWYVFILVNASQGLYILIALTPCKNVRQFFQSKF